MEEGQAVELEGESSEEDISALEEAEQRQHRLSIMDKKQFVAKTHRNAKKKHPLPHTVS